MVMDISIRHYKITVHVVDYLTMGSNTLGNKHRDSYCNWHCVTVVIIIGLGIALV